MSKNFKAEIAKQDKRQLQIIEQRNAEIAKTADRRQISRLVANDVVGMEEVQQAEESFWYGVFDGLELTVRYKQFVMAYVQCGMNGTEAYGIVYKKEKNKNHCASASSRLLRNVNISKAVDRALVTQGITEEWVTKKTAEIINDKEGDTGHKIRGLELMSKIKGLNQSVQRQHVVKESYNVKVGWGK